MRLERVMLALAFFWFATVAWPQTWSPQKNVEIVVTSAPGGSNDKTARTVDYAAMKAVLTELGLAKQ
jgi:putative tricarboxylic transport membrane protein